MARISGVERRRRWSKEAKLEILAETDQPGVRIGDVARRHDIYPAQIRLWRAVMIEPRGKGIVLWTLRYGDEVRDEDSYFEAIADEEADPEMMPLVQQLIKKQTKDWSPKMVADPVQERLLDIIAAKKKALKQPAKAKGKSALSSPPNNVVNIMDALKKSVAAEKRAGR
ncbi:transposase [Rhizobium sp. 3T7]|uniref:transposase n=1 Tax=Rhizobium sp. 3T7 TaxID=2874922 RepID=UPI001CCCF2DD|nr:transposase [Rhizobium sp. 3T7]